MGDWRKELGGTGHLKRGGNGVRVHRHSPQRVLLMMNGPWYCLPWLYAVLSVENSKT